MYRRRTRSFASQLLLDALRGGRGATQEGLASPMKPNYFLPVFIMKFFSAFAGVGGFDLPLVEAGHECVGFSEIDRHAITAYLHHFPSHKNYGDISILDPHTLPYFDLLTGGFPCQSFSVAGKQRGFKDARGLLFFNLWAIAEAKKPRLLLFENVEGLLRNDAGRTFWRILSALDGIGYDLQWQVLNSRHWLPQNRQRVFLVGNLRETPRPQVFPIPVGSRKSVAAGWTVIANAFDEGEPYSWDCVNCIAASYRGRLGRSKPVLMQPDRRIRGLTPLECERLQGFPDGWTEMLPDDQRYQCVGNSVTVPVVREIVNRLT